MKARFNGVDLYLETRGGAGPSIVLVHGSWGDNHIWDGVVPLLARSCRVTTGPRTSLTPPAKKFLKNGRPDRSAM